MRGGEPICSGFRGGEPRMRGSTGSRIASWEGCDWTRWPVTAFLADQTSARDSGFMVESLSDWADLMQLVGFPLAILALLLAWGQLRKATKTARLQTLLALDERLSDFEDVRAKVNDGDLNIDSRRLRRYIAAFERVGNALRLQEIDLATVDRFYGDRFARLTSRGDARSIVKGRREAWEDFYYLWEELRGCKGSKREWSELP
ncbi:MAG TPA: hypothetical protein VLW50_19530 [Streptosporangiaceae bacterium]|nr:hypothetical protein [Streptosporangiaceae bacterium]